MVIELKALVGVGLWVLLLRVDGDGEIGYDRRGSMLEWRESGVSVGGGRAYGGE